MAGETILVVDDSRPTREFIVDYVLKPKGFLAILAVDGEEGVQLALEQDPDLIILDLSAPGESALELCRSLKGDPGTRSTPLIVVASEETSPTVRRLGADAIVRRPIVAREYHAAIGRFVRLPKRRVRRRLSNLRIAYDDGHETGQAFTRDLSSGQGDFLSLAAEIRRYMPLAREVVWAHRAAAEASFGDDRENYYLGGTSSLRAILYMDEVFGYFPPTANPPSKTPMLTLLKQARAYGLGIVLATQNPVDLDYKGLSNTGTWFLGRLQTERDKARVLEGLEGASATAGSPFDRGKMEATLAALGQAIHI